MEVGDTILMARRVNGQTVWENDKTIISDIFTMMSTNKVKYCITSHYNPHRHFGINNFPIRTTRMVLIEKTLKAFRHQEEEETV